jgi:hypothetical protein
LDLESVVTKLQININSRKRRDIYKETLNLQCNLVVLRLGCLDVPFLKESGSSGAPNQDDTTSVLSATSESFSNRFTTTAMTAPTEASHDLDNQEKALNPASTNGTTNTKSSSWFGMDANPSSI